MFFLKKILLGLGALVLIFIGGTGTQSNSMLLQGGGFIGLIIGLVVLYIFGKMAWRAMGCLPSFLVVTCILLFILYAIGGFNNGVSGVGQSLRTFLGQQGNAQRQVQPQKAALNLMDDDSDYGPAIDENFSSEIGSQVASPSIPQQQPQTQQPQEAAPSPLKQLMNSFTGQQAAPQAEFNPSNFPAIYGVARVINGDTLAIDGSYFKLYGIDAPESNQSCADRQGRSYNCGREAALWLKNWITTNELECRVMQQDSRGNMVGTCSLGQYDLGAALVNAGWAVAYSKYTDVYAPYEYQAKIHKRGLWQGQFYMPWDWRAQQAKKPKIKIIKPKTRRKGILDL